MGIFDGDGGFGFPGVRDGGRLQWSCSGSSGSEARDRGSWSFVR